MRQFILTVWVLVAINIHIAASYCESDLVVVSNGINYEDAVKLCKSRGMNLVKIEDEQTNQMVYNFVVKRNLGKYWIDGKRGPGGKQWVYNDGSQLTYSKFHAGEPNNQHGIENCLEGFHFRDATWNDVPCSVKNAAICYVERSTTDFCESDLVVISSGIDYEGAVNLCKSRGMNLVKIEDEQTNQMVYNFVVKRKLGKYWIDGKRGPGGKQWIYNDGSQLIYSKFHAGEPNNQYGIENCLEGFHFKDATWNDIPCSLKNAAICYTEKPKVKGPDSESDLCVVSKGINYEGAVNLCKSRGMNLVRIENEKTNQMVYNFVVKRKLGKYWIDGKRGPGGKQWIHNDGSQLIYSKFHAGEPNNALGNENCLEGFYFNDPTWNDDPCSLNNAAICYVEKSTCL